MNGGGDSVCIMIGASNHSLKVRERNDYYATPPVAVERLLELEEFHGRRILEPCCGEGHISKVLERRYEVVSNDLIDRGFGNPGIDFLGDEITEWDGDIVMNPPYGLSMEVMPTIATIHSFNAIVIMVPSSKVECNEVKVNGIPKHR